MLKVTLAMLVFLALVGFALLQLVMGCQGLAQLAGVVGAVLGVLAWLLLGFRLPLQIGAFFAAMTLWHWPWFPALLFAAPRQVLMLPWLVARLLARVRHPPPKWQRAAGVQGP